MKLKRSGIITKIIVFTLLIYAAATLLSLRTRIDSAMAEQATVKKLVVEKELSNAELEYAIANSDNDEVIADIARTNLGLIMPGEIVFYDGAAIPETAE